MAVRMRDRWISQAGEWLEDLWEGIGMREVDLGGGGNWEGRGVPRGMWEGGEGKGGWVNENINSGKETSESSTISSDEEANDTDSEEIQDLESLPPLPPSPTLSKQAPDLYRKKKRKYHPRKPETEASLLATVEMYRTPDGKLWRWPGQRDMRYGEDLHMPKGAAVWFHTQKPPVVVPAGLGNAAAGGIGVAGAGDATAGEGESGGEGGDGQVTEKENVPGAEGEGAEGETAEEETTEVGKGEPDSKVAESVGHDADTEKEGDLEEPSLKTRAELPAGKTQFMEEDISLTNIPSPYNIPQSETLENTPHPSSSSSDPPKRKPVALLPPLQVPLSPLLHPPTTNPPTPLSPTPLASNHPQSTHKAAGPKGPTFFSPEFEPSPQPRNLEALQLKYFISQRRYKTQLAQLDAQIKVLSEAITEILGMDLEEYVARDRKREQEIIEMKEKERLEKEQKETLKKEKKEKRREKESRRKSKGKKKEKGRGNGKEKTKGEEGAGEGGAGTNKPTRPLLVATRRPPPRLFVHLESDSDYSDTSHSQTSDSEWSDDDALDDKGKRNKATLKEKRKKEKQRKYELKRNQRNLKMEANNKVFVERTKATEERFIDGLRQQVIKLRQLGLEKKSQQASRKPDPKGKGKARAYSPPPPAPLDPKPSPMSTLPTEILEQILSIPRTSVQASTLSRVCRSWHTILTPKIYARVEFGDTVEDIEGELMERMGLRREGAKQRRERKRRRMERERGVLASATASIVPGPSHSSAAPVGPGAVAQGSSNPTNDSSTATNKALTLSTAASIHSSCPSPTVSIPTCYEGDNFSYGTDRDSDDALSEPEEDQYIQFREGKAVLAVMPISIGLLRSLCKPHLAKHTRALFYRGGTHNSFPNRETLSLYFGADLTELIVLRKAARRTILELARKAVKLMRNLEMLVIDSGDAHVANALLGALKWAPKLRGLHLEAMNTRELQFVRGKGSSYEEPNLVVVEPGEDPGPNDDQDSESEKKPKDGKQEGPQKTPDIAEEKKDGGLSGLGEDCSKVLPTASSSVGPSIPHVANGRHPIRVLFPTDAMPSEFTYNLERLTIYRCGYHLTKEKHTRKANRKGMIAVAEEEELKASAKLIPLLRRCKRLKYLKIEGSHMEPEAVLGSWFRPKMAGDKIGEIPEELEEDEQASLSSAPQPQPTAEVDVGGGSPSALAASEGTSAGPAGVTPAQPESNPLPTSPEEAQVEGPQDENDGRQYLTFPDLQRLTLRGCGFFRGFETPPTWLSSPGYEKFFLRHRIKKLSWPGWILSRHLKLNNPAFVRVGRHLGETLSSLTITHYYDDSKLNIHPAEAHGIVFRFERLLTLLGYLKSLEFFSLNLNRIRMSHVLDVAQTLRNNKMKRLRISNVYGAIGVDEAKLLVECLPDIKELSLPYLMYPEDEYAKQIFEQEDREAAGADGDDAAEGGPAAAQGDIWPVPAGPPVVFVVNNDPGTGQGPPTLGPGVALALPFLLPSVQPQAPAGGAQGQAPAGTQGQAAAGTQGEGAAGGGAQADAAGAGIVAAATLGPEPNPVPLLPLENEPETLPINRPKETFTDVVSFPILWITPPCLSYWRLGN